MSRLDALLADLERVAEVCNRFADPDLGKAAFNLLAATLDTPPRPPEYPARRAAEHFGDNTTTAVLPAVRR